MERDRDPELGARLPELVKAGVTRLERLHGRVKLTHAAEPDRFENRAAERLINNCDDPLRHESARC